MQRRQTVCQEERVNLRKSITIGKEDKEMKKERIKPIPEKIYNKIIQCAVNKEKDILTKAGILIQSLTGLKILDMLALQEGCVKEAEEKDSFGSPYYLDVRIDDEKKGTPGVHRSLLRGIILLMRRVNCSI